MVRCIPSDSNRTGQQGQPARIVALLMLTLIGISSARRLYAQTPPAEEVRYTMALVGVPLGDALERLLDETKLSLIYETDLVKGRTTFCKGERVSAEALLRCILNDTGLDFIRLSSGTYVLIKDPRAAPRYASLTGQVLDATTGTPLADANVLLVGEERGTATNRNGRFAFAALRPGPHRLVVTHVAYHDVADTLYIAPDEQGLTSIRLRPRIVLSEPVIVTGFEARLPSDDLGRGYIEADEYLRAGGIGTLDVVQELEAVVGVHLGDALSDVHVQGGASNEQQFLLDGVPIFVPVPNGGFIGPFSPFAAGRVTVQKAGFSAAHGSGLSGVIEVEHHLAPDAGASLTAQVDPLSLNARWNSQAGSLDKVHAVWMVALRKGLWDVYAPPRLEALFQRWSTPDGFLLDALQEHEDVPFVFGTPESSKVEVGFNDLHAAAQVRFGGLRSLHVSLYRGANAFGIDEVALAGGDPATEPYADDFYEDAYRWSNRAIQLRYEWVQNHRLFMHVGTWATNYHLVHPVAGLDDGTAPPASEEFNEVAERGMRLSSDWAVAGWHTLSAALEATHTDSDFALSLDPFGQFPVGPERIRPARWRFAAFVEDRIVLSHRATLTFGTRLTYLPLNKTIYAEPRLAIQYDHEVGQGGSWAVRGAVGRYRQYLHAFDVATYNVKALVPRVRFWLPVGRTQRPPEAYHATAAFLYRPDATWQFGVETYYKHQPHLLVLNYGSLVQAGLAEDVLTLADGYAYGAAVTASRKGQRVQLTVQYEYAVARRRVANRFDGKFVPVPWDAPHRFYGALDVHPLRHWTATVRWQGVWGRSWGFRQAYYDFLEPRLSTRTFPPYDLSDPTVHQLPVFSQWDVGVAYARDLMGMGVQGRITFINLLGRHNVMDWSLHHEESSSGYVQQARRATPFLPAFSLRLSL